MQLDRLLSVCPDCGQVFERDEVTQRASCSDCHDTTGNNNSTFLNRGKSTTASRGYGSIWQRLSKRARKLQPFCSDCGSPEDLTCDHTPEAWERFDAGKSLRLKDIDVVCARCNSERGAARGEGADNYWGNRGAGKSWGKEFGE